MFVTIDGTASAPSLALRHIHDLSLRILLRYSLVLPVNVCTNWSVELGRVGDIWVVSLIVAGLDDSDSYGRVLGQTVGDDETCGAASDHNVVDTGSGRNTGEGEEMLELHLGGTCSRGVVIFTMISRAAYASDLTFLAAGLQYKDPPECN